VACPASKMVSNCCFWTGETKTLVVAGDGLKRISGLRPPSGTLDFGKDE
jgi:hypothetical protein